MSRYLACFCLLYCLCAAQALADAPPGALAPKPLFRDPVYDGAADPILVRDAAHDRWLMYYTNRRASAPPAETPGVSWVHGTEIGVAESRDGAHWTYLGTCDIRHGGDDSTWWAPDVLVHQGLFHMYLTHVPGVFNDWGHPREILHLTSRDGLAWDYQSTLPLASDRVIDASVFQLPGGAWRLWYNNERDRKSIYFADSPDLTRWTDRGKVTGVGERPGEGPKVFRWRGRYWMVVDLWDGLGVYRSEDARRWAAQPGNLLREPGRGADDGAKGQHPDVQVAGDRAFIYYFTHPGRDAAGRAATPLDERRSSLQVAELTLGDDGWLRCDRDAPTHVRLTEPAGDPTP